MFQNNSLFYHEDHTVYFVDYGTINSSFTLYDNMTRYNDPVIDSALRPLVFIREYISPVIFSIGIFFNVFSALFLRKTECKNVTPFVYLLALCIVDTVYLLARLVPGKLYNVYVMTGVCQIVNYVSFLSIFLEWWFSVMVLCERCLALYSWRLACKYCSPFRIKCAIITVSICAIVAHLYHTWTSIVHDNGGIKNCIIIPEFFQYITMLRQLDVIFAFILPFILIMVMVGIILFQLCRRKRRVRSDVTQFIASTGTMAKRPISLSVESRERIRRIPEGLSLRILVSKRGITIKILIIVIFKLVLCIPHDMLKAKMTFSTSYEAERIERIVLLYLNEVYCLNFSMKGVLCLIMFPCFRRLTSIYMISKLRLICQKICARGRAEL